MPEWTKSNEFYITEWKTGWFYAGVCDGLGVAYCNNTQGVVVEADEMFGF